LIEINNIIFAISQKGISIQFLWVPAHGVGKPGERGNQVEIQLSFPLCKSEVKVLIKHKVNNIWQAKWNKEKKGTRLYNIQQDILSSKHIYPNRHEEVWFTRMKIGHTGLNNSLHVTHKHPSGKCEICGVREDVDRVLLRCIEGSECSQKNLFVRNIIM